VPANSVYRYGAGASSIRGRRTAEYLLDQFARNGYRLPDLLKFIATSDAFYAVRPAGDVKEAGL